MDYRKHRGIAGRHNKCRDDYRRWCAWFPNHPFPVPLDIWSA
jgi:hypothetical protein